MTLVQARAVSLSTSDLVKMEERKRPASHDHDSSEPPLKRQATTVNGASKAHIDADMPWKDDLEVSKPCGYDTHLYCLEGIYDLSLAHGILQYDTDCLLPLQRFQKEAIVRQMQEYKRERNNLEAQLNIMKKSAIHHDEHLLMIDACFSQVSDGFLPISTSMMS